MSFVNPIFLWGLLFVSIPVLIHLFNLRRFKKVYFSNVGMLKELKQDTQKKSRIKHLLVLLSRILAVVFLVLAFAQPFIPVSDSKVSASGSNVSVYIDNSASMEAISAKGTLFNDAVSKALEIAAAYNITDLFQIISADFDSKHQALFSKEDYIRLVNELKISSSTRLLSEVISRQSDILNDNGKTKIIYLISDFQKSVSDFDAIKNDSSTQVYLIPLESTKSQNIYIDSCWFESPVLQTNHTNKLYVLIKNNSDEDVEKIPVKLSINGVQKIISSVDVLAGSQAIVNLAFTISEQGIQHAKVEISDSPIIFDDAFYFSFYTTEKIPVLTVNASAENSYLKALFAEDSAINYKNQNEKTLDYSLLKTYSCVILNDVKTISSGLAQELSVFVKKGGSLMVFPSDNIDKASYSSFLSLLEVPAYANIDTAFSKIDKLNTEHPIYKDVFDKVNDNIDLPKAFNHYTFSSKASGADEVLMKMQNGDPFILYTASGKGKVYLSSVPLNNDWSNFPKNAIFVPTLFNIALLSIPNNKLYYTIGMDDAVSVAFAELGNDATFSIKAYKKDFEFIPEHKNIGLEYFVFPHNQISEAGNYTLLAGNKEINGIAYNYSRLESNMKCYTSDELEEIIKTKNLKNFKVLDSKEKPISKVLEELNQGIRLWKLFIILGLLSLLAEVLLLRFKK